MKYYGSAEVRPKKQHQPVSVQVGATAAVGLLEGTGGVSWNIMGKTAIGWVMTLVVVGLLSAVMMALGVYSPNLSASKALAKIRGSVNTVSMQATDILEGNCEDHANIDCSDFQRRYIHQQCLC